MSTRSRRGLTWFAEEARRDDGAALAMVVAVAAVLFVLLTALVTVTVQQSMMSSIHFNRSKILDVADAGISAYMHELQGYWYFYESTPTISGTTGEGSWTVTASPPAAGSSVIKLESYAQIPSQGLTRRVVAYVRPPSFADYVMIVDNPGKTLSIGSVMTGKVHANGSISLSGGSISGLASAVTALSGTGYNGGKWCPAPAIDFTTVTTDLNSIKEISKVAANNSYIPTAGVSATGTAYVGWKLDLNNTQYTVTRIKTVSASTAATTGTAWTLETTTNPTYAAITRTIPDSGTMYFEAPSPVWISGTYSKSLTIGVGADLRGPVSSYLRTDPSSVYLWNSIFPADRSSTSMQFCGIVSPGDISVPAWFAASPASFTVQASILSQNGSFHSDDATNNAKLRTFFGVIGSQAFKNDAVFSNGFTTRTFTWDERFNRGSPPQFPRPVVNGGSALNVVAWSDSP